MQRPAAAQAGDSRRAVSRRRGPPWLAAALLRPVLPNGEGGYYALASAVSAVWGSGRSTSSISAMGALSPTRKPNFRMRV
jgi:hypothetical protein